MAADDAATRAYYESLPGKRIGAGILCRDGDGRVLLVQPTYKPMWEVPGGIVEAGESPRAAVAREVREELGIELPVGRLLVVDWLPVRPPKTEGLMMLFDGGVLSDADTFRFALPSSELAGWAYFDAADLDDVLPEHMARRIRVALELALTERSAYLESGRPAAEMGSQRPALVLMKGPPGSGKSTLARELGRRLGWPVIDKDTFRDLLPDGLGGISYEAMLNVCREQLLIGLSVIGDSPLGYGAGYREAMRIAGGAGVVPLVIECRCSNAAMWRSRIEQRRGHDLAEHHATEWADVEAFRARTTTDPYEVSVGHLLVDTAQPIEACVGVARNWLAGVLARPFSSDSRSHDDGWQ